MKTYVKTILVAVIAVLMTLLVPRGEAWAAPIESIVYTDGDAIAYRIDPTGLNSAQLAALLSPVPARVLPSRDGMSILSGTAASTTPTRLFSSTPDGSGPLEYPSGTIQYSLNYVFSPTPGAQIAFSGRPAGSSTYRSIYTMNAADGSGLTLITSPGVRDHKVLDWDSPGILYVGGAGPGVLSVVDPVTKVSRQIAASSYNISDARYFKVGAVTKVAMIARTLTTNYALYIINDVSTATSATIPTALTTTPALTGLQAVAPSVDGTKLAVIANNTPTNATYRIWNVVIATGAATEIVTTKLGSNGTIASNLSWAMLEQPGTPTTLTTVNVTGAYSDQVTLSARLVRQADGVPVPGQTISFKVNGTTLAATATTDLNGDANLPFTITLPAGTYTVEAIYAGTLSFGASSSGNRTLTVTQESGTLQYTGDTLWAPTVNLSATLTEVADAWPGTLSLAGNVEFVIRRPDGSAQTTVSAPISVGGTASTTAALPLGAYGVTVRLPSNPYYSAADVAAIIEANTAITPAQATQNATYSDPVSVKATLKVAGGSAVGAGEAVDITILDQANVTVASYSATTDATGTVTWPYTPTLKAGTYTVSYAHPASAYYRASSATSTLIVAEESAALTYTGDTSWNTTVNLRAQLTETADGNPGQATAAGSVTFAVTLPDGTPVGTWTAPIVGAGGTGTATYTATLPAGPYRVQASLDPANGYYTAPAASAIINVTTKVAVTAPTTAYSDATTLEAFLTLQDGTTPVGGEVVNFTVRDSTNATVATGTGTTLANGRATFPFTPTTKSGTYAVTANYAGSSFYQPSAGSASLAVTLEDATLAYTGPTLWTGSSVTLTASVTEVADSSPGDITKLNSQVQFIVRRPDNSTVGTFTAAVAGAAGAGTASANVTLPAGAYSVTVHLLPANGYYQAADATGIIKANTAMTMANGNGIYSDPLTMTANLTVSGGAAIASAPVTFTVLDSSMTAVKTVNATTDATGKATLSFTNDLPAGAYTVQASYAATAYYNATSVTANLTIGVENAVLAYTGQTAWSGATVTLSASVNEAGADGYPGVISNAGSVDFVVTRPDGSLVGTYSAAIVGAAGTGSASTTANLPAGAYNVEVQLPANAYYQASSVTAIIKVATTLTMANDTVQYSDQRTMRANLAVTGGGSLGAGFPVAFTVKDSLGATVTTGTVNTDGSGNADFTLNADVKAGNYTVTANYAGNSYYNSSTVSANLVVTLEDATLAYTGDLLWTSSTVQLSATVAEVADARAGQINRATSVSFIVTDKNGVAKGTFTAPITGAGASGTASTTATLPAGGYNVTVRLNTTNGYYQATDVPATIKVNTALTVPAASIDYSDSVSLQATLRFSDATPVVGESLTFTVRNPANVVVKTGSATTNAAGVATFGYDADGAAGAYTVQVDYAATTHYNAASGSGTLTVNLEKATLAYTGDNVWSSSITLSATITEEGAPDTRKGDPVNAGNLQFIVTKPDGTPVTTYSAPITGTNGTGSASVSASLPAGIYVVTVHLDPANGYYQAVDVSAGIRADTVTTLSLPSVRYSDPTAISATVKLNDGTPVAAGETVSFTMKDATNTTVKTGTGTTDASGVVNWIFPMTFKVGTYTVEATYAGGTYYNPSNASGSQSVALEDATLSYTGPTLWTGTAVTLTGKITEVADDVWPGDVTKAGSLQFTVRRPDGSVAATATGTILAGGNASANVTLPAGAYQVTVHLDSANGYYQAADATGYIRANTAIAMTPSPVAYSDEVVIQATLSVAGGPAVGVGETITFTVTNSGGTTVGSGTGTTLASGIASFTFSAASAPAGSYTVKADYAGPSSYYNAATLSGPLTVNKEDATLAYTGDTTWTSGSINLQASINEVNDSWPGLITNAGSLQFVLQRPDGSALPAYTAPVTGAGTSGTASTSVTLPSNGYKVTVQLPSNSYYTATDVVGYIKADTVLSLAAPAATQYSDVVNIAATLSVVGGSPVGAGESVVFTVKDGLGATVKTSAPVLTNGSGVATWAYPVDLPAGNYTVVAD
ncbi:MAG TPA: Ig-like domain repeat protein, partial [Symbiobacteriaceae bacterium]|nr:Ig-like domain repeat protein [Symbiobacteriaceae bacterium]